jgi:hypothetical protein
VAAPETARLFIVAWGARRNAEMRSPLTVEQIEDHRWSVDLPNATLLASPSTLIFLFKRGLSRSNLVFLGGASDE